MSHIVFFVLIVAIAIVYFIAHRKHDAPVVATESLEAAKVEDKVEAEVAVAKAELAEVKTEAVAVEADVAKVF